LKPWLDNRLLEKSPAVTFFECNNQTFTATIHGALYQAIIRNDRFLKVMETKSLRHSSETEGIVSREK